MYILIGALSAGFDFVVFTLLVEIANFPKEVSNLISIFCGIILSFVLNAKFNFKVKDQILERFSRFAIIGVIGFLISTFLIIILSDFLGLDPVFSKIVTIPMVAILQYLLNVRFSFR